MGEEEQKYYEFINQAHHIQMRVQYWCNFFEFPDKFFKTVDASYYELIRNSPKNPVANIRLWTDFDKITNDVSNGVTRFLIHKKLDERIY